MVTHPFKRELHILHTGVAGSCKVGAAHFAEIQITEDVQSMIYSHDDQVAALR
jgi:hypothetical protein